MQRPGRSGTWDRFPNLSPPAARGRSRPEARPGRLETYPTADHLPGSRPRFAEHRYQILLWASATTSSRTRHRLPRHDSLPCCVRRRPRACPPAASPRHHRGQVEGSRRVLGRSGRCSSAGPRSRRGPGPRSQDQEPSGDATACTQLRSRRGLRARPSRRMTRPRWRFPARTKCRGNPDAVPDRVQASAPDRAMLANENSPAIASGPRCAMRSTGRPTASTPWMDLESTQAPLPGA